MGNTNHHLAVDWGNSRLNANGSKIAIDLPDEALQNESLQNFYVSNRELACRLSTERHPTP